jgi:tetratricopeptide (TPR) repeat protein
MALDVELIHQLEVGLENINQTHRTDLIIDQAKKILALDPINYFSTVCLLRAYVNSHQYELLLEAGTDALKNWPNDHRIHHLLFYYYLAKGGADYVKAKEHLEIAIKYSPNSGYLYRDLGEIYLINREPDKAERILAKAVSLTPDNPEFRSRLALAMLRNKKVQEAIAEAEKALSEAPDNHDVLDTVGMIYILCGELEKAENLFKEALKRNPTYTYFQKHLDWIEREKKDKAERLRQGKKYTPQYIRQTGSKRWFDEDKPA